MPAAVAQGIRGVFCDIDDTLTSEGKLGARAYSALERLHSAGKLVVPITGRPAGWCDHIARMWPVDAVVGENGAFYFYYDAARKKLAQRFLFDAHTRAANREKMLAVRERILREVPGCALASDQRYREADLAIDYCEDVPRLPFAEVDRIVGTDARGRHDRENQLDPRQRLVRRLRQAGHDAHLDAGTLRRRSRA